MTDRQFEHKIRLIVEGDRQGLKEIYEEYSKMIYSVVFEVLRSRENSEDVMSDFFLKLWSIANTYTFGGKHKRWLVTIAKNMAIDFVRKHKNEQFSIDDESCPAELFVNSSSTENTVIEKISIDSALDTLNNTEREIINLKLMADLSFKDIARLLNKPMGTVAWKYRGAMQKLKRLIREVQF